MRTKLTKEERKANMAAAKDAKKSKKKEKINENKGKKDKLVKNQKKCFVQLFKFSSGMTCLICNANYATYTSG